MENKKLAWHNSDFIEKQQQKLDMEEEESSEEDDWNPNPSKYTILQKVKVNFSDKVLKKNEKKQEEREKTEINNQNQNEQFNIPEPKRQKKEDQEQQNQNTKEENQDKKELEDDFFEDSDMENEDKQKNQPPPEFYDPMKDEKYESWVHKSLKKEEESQIVLSCPQCFTQLCYDCQAHETIDNQYRAVFVKNTKINTQRIITPQEIKTKQKSKKQKQQQQNNENIDEEEENPANNNNMNQDNNFWESIDQKCQKFSEKQLEDKNFLDKGRKNFEIFFQTQCAHCDIEVGVFEADSKIYIFHNVIPSLG